jgi:hypothetical protein
MCQGNSQAHGRAALMLCESLVHLLIERSVISVPEAIDAVETVSEIRNGMGDEACRAETLGLLRAITSSLSAIGPVGQA